MLLRKNTKRHILRVVCMIMLMLIHFDAYGYELAAVFQEVNAEHVLPVSEAETQIVQGNDVEIEWADPVYRHSSLQQRSVVKMFFTLCGFWGFLVTCFRLVLPRYYVFADFGKGKIRQVHLLYCLLLI